MCTHRQSTVPPCTEVVASFSKEMIDTEIFLIERLARLYVAVAVSNGHGSNRSLRSPILQTVKISQSRTAVAAGELFVVEEKKPELLAAWPARADRLRGQQLWLLLFHNEQLAGGDGCP